LSDLDEKKQQAHTIPNQHAHTYVEEPWRAYHSPGLLIHVPYPIAYYLPPSSFTIPLTPTKRKTWCEWKGAATYYEVTSPSDGKEVSNRIWSYDSPTGGFEPIKGYLSMYAGPWDCFVDGEKVEAQPGNFYGGWVTSEIEGIVKGKNGNWDPVV
jgi:uncharacterized protein (DUF427 family)